VIEVQVLYELPGYHDGQLNVKRNPLEFPRPDQTEFEAGICHAGISANPRPAHPILRAIAPRPSLLLVPLQGVVINFSPTGPSEGLVSVRFEPSLPAVATAATDQHRSTNALTFRFNAERSGPLAGPAEVFSGASLPVLRNVVWLPAFYTTFQQTAWAHASPEILVSWSKLCGRPSRSSEIP